MALEDEIINIADIDISTEILKDDKLLIETSNGTKLVAFKDFVIGEDNISFKQKLLDVAAIGSTQATTTSVTGFNILSENTSPGHVTRYADISGTVELGKFNYNAIVQLAALSGTTSNNTARINEAIINLEKLGDILANTDNTALNSITLTTSAANWEVTGPVNGTGGYNIETGGNKVTMGFSNIALNPAETNTNVTFQASPFKWTAPSATGQGFDNPSRFMITGSFRQSGRGDRASGPGMAKPGEIVIYKNNTEIFRSQTSVIGKKETGYNYFSFVETIGINDIITIDNPMASGNDGGNVTSGTFRGFKIG